jgi:hypothetical protein
MYLVPHIGGEPFTTFQSPTRALSMALDLLQAIGEVLFQRKAALREGVTVDCISRQIKALEALQLLETNGNCAREDVVLLRPPPPPPPPTPPTHHTTTTSNTIR